MCNGYSWPRSKCKNHKTDIRKPDGKASSVLKLHIYFVIYKTVNVFGFFQISWSTKNLPAVLSLFLPQPSKILLLPMNGLGVACTKGTDCSDDQVCDALKCVSCKENKKPDEDREKCEPTSNNGEPNCGYLFNVILISLTIWIFFFTYL